MCSSAACVQYEICPFCLKIPQARSDELVDLASIGIPRPIQDPVVVNNDYKRGVLKLIAPLGRQSTSPTLGGNANAPEEQTM